MDSQLFISAILGLSLVGHLVTVRFLARLLSAANDRVLLLADPFALERVLLARQSRTPNVSLHRPNEIVEEQQREAPRRAGADDLMGQPFGDIWKPIPAGRSD